MRHFCGAKELGPDYTFIHCLRVYLLLVSPVRYSIKSMFAYQQNKMLSPVTRKLEGMTI